MLVFHHGYGEHVQRYEQGRIRSERERCERERAMREREREKARLGDGVLCLSLFQSWCLRDEQKFPLFRGVELRRAKEVKKESH